VAIEPDDKLEDEFERELRQAFARRPAPPSLKRRLTASVALTAALAGGVQWRIIDQRRKEEAARAQVFLALRITSHALNQMNARLAAHHRGGQD